MASQLKILVPGGTHLVDLVGQRDELLHVIEGAFDSDILVRGNEITITGDKDEAELVATVFEELVTLLQRGQVLTAESVERTVRMVKADGGPRPSEVLSDTIVVTRGRAIRAKTPGQKRYVDAIRDHTLVFSIGPAGTGKCVAGDTLVLSDRGMLPIRTFGEGMEPDTHREIDLTIHGSEGAEPAGHVYAGGSSETRRVTTRLGYSIEVTPEHPLLVNDPHEGLVWRRADELRVGDWLALQRGQRMFGSRSSIDFTYEPKRTSGDTSKVVCVEELDGDLGYVLGLLVGDGCLTFPNRVILSSADAEITSAFTAMATRLGLHTFPNGKGRPYDRIVASSQLYQLLGHLGLSLGAARSKRIPQAVLEAPEDVVASFLRGLFDTDGSVERRDGVVTFSSVSEDLARQVQVVLLNFGVVASLTRKRGRYLGRTHLSWLLTIAGAEADRFSEVIGFGLARKRERLMTRRRNTNVDVVPGADTLLLAAKRTTRLSRAEHRRFGDYEVGRRRPSYGKLDELLTILETHGASGVEMERLRELSQRRLLFLQVTDIENSKAEVFDLTVPGTHSFVANGFVNHNTYLAVAMAVKALREKEISRIILTRPAVEAGERLGFLPGDIAAKVDPYLKPLYDALYEMLEPEHFARLAERGTIEVAPLAYMRGRAQPYFSRVLTPSGFRPIGSLRVGDEVIGSDGRPTSVLGVYPQGEKEVFRLTTQDGASTLCCAEHLWAVHTDHDRRRGEPARVLETGEMVGRLRAAHSHRFELPLVSAPADLGCREVPMDPYALGLVLRDGGLTGSTAPAGGGRGGVMVADPVTAVLPELGLGDACSATRLVPDDYLYNTPDVRLAVLQGLLDADGEPVARTGRTRRVRYVTTSSRLRDDVVFLVRSLGGVAHVGVRRAAGPTPGRAKGRHGTNAYVLDIRLPAGIAPFRLGRKLDAYERGGGGRPMRFVHAIEPAGKEETVCIRVAAPDSLYVTDDFLLTHNTLNDSFIILDEAQNTTPEQMKMFLTRLGLRSKAVVTGDITQVDLPEGQTSGLRVVQEILQGIEGLSFVHLDAYDVVRHRIVQDIVEAYRVFDEARRKQR